MSLSDAFVFIYLLLRFSGQTAQKRANDGPRAD